MITPSSPSNSSDGISSSSSNTRTAGKDNNEFGKQIVELISRLINEADPESEKINIEFIITPFQKNETFASKNPKMVSTSVPHTASDANRLRNLRRRQSSPSLSISSRDGNNSNAIISISSASFSPHKTTPTSKEESEKFDELSYAYYQSLVQKERMQRQYLEEMPSKPQSPIMQKAAKKSKKKRRSKKNKKRESSSMNSSSQLEQSKMNSENKSVKKRSKKSSKKKHHRRRHESPDGEYNANWYIE